MYVLLYGVADRRMTPTFVSCECIPGLPCIGFPLAVAKVVAFVDQDESIAA